MSLLFRRPPRQLRRRRRSRRRSTSPSIRATHVRRLRGRDRPDSGATAWRVRSCGEALGQGRGGGGRRRGPVGAAAAPLFLTAFVVGVEQWRGGARHQSLPR
jgi:hypothetical protein